jgi:hypothetical protein
MGKVLLTFVGEQDPYSNKTDSEGSIVTLVKSISPDLVYMLPSKRLPGIKSETESNAILTKEWLIDFVKLDKKNIYLYPLSITDPRNIPVLLDQGSVEIKRILETLGEEDVELAINTSSGTPQMQSCWYIWVNSGLFAPYQVTLYQVGNPLYAPEEKRVETLTVEFMEEGNTVERIRKYLENMMYLSAAEEATRLSKISCYSNRRAKAEIIADISKAYHDWDLLNYTSTLSLLRAKLARYEKSIDLVNFTELLKKQIEILVQLNNVESDEITVLTDIYYNAQRRFCQNAYADTLARIWRLIEGCLYCCLRNKHGIEPRNFGSSKNKDNMRKITSILQVFKELSFSKSVSALKDALKDTGYIAFEKREVELPWGDNIRKQRIGAAMDDIRIIRNESIVAHGIKPVSREVAQSSLEVGKLFLEFTFKNNTFVRAYPFKGDECVNSLMELLY